MGIVSPAMKPARRVGLVWAIVFTGLEIISYLTYYDRLAEQILIHAAKHRVEEKTLETAGFCHRLFQGWGYLHFFLSM